MWQYNSIGTLCHGDRKDHKYISKHLSKSGKWVYEYANSIDEISDKINDVAGKEAKEDYEYYNSTRNGALEILKAEREYKRLYESDLKKKDQKLEYYKKELDKADKELSTTESKLRTMKEKLSRGSLTTTDKISISRAIIQDEAKVKHIKEHRFGIDSMMNDLKLSREETENKLRETNKRISVSAQSYAYASTRSNQSLAAYTESPTYQREQTKKKVDTFFDKVFK